MMTREYFKKRRAAMRAKGICVDCQLRPVQYGTARQGKLHVLCTTCLEARRERYRNGGIPPLMKQMLRAAE